MSKLIDNSPLISFQQLQSILGETHVKIFDVRGKWDIPPIHHYEAYLEGHIPGAHFLEWSAHFLETDKPVNLAAVASQEQAQESFKALGISKDDLVVLYDDYHHMLAGRVWWAMRYWGFTNVKVLNGGWKCWLANAEAKDELISQEIPDTVVGDFIASQQPELNASLELVKNRDADTLLIDARGPINYGGKPEDPKTGHIPGAINIPYSSLLDSESGMFKSREALIELIEAKLKHLNQVEIISSCGSGYAGTVMLLALKIIGVDAALFDGSFAVWKSQEDLPIEQGNT